MSENKKPRLPKPKDDLSALFPNREHEEAFHQWSRENSALIKFFNENPDSIKSLLYAISEFWYERVNKGWAETIELVERQSEIITSLEAQIPLAAKQGELAAIISNAKALEAHAKRIIALAKGRRMGAEAQKQYAAETQEIIIGINADLLKNPNTARWDLERRADYIAEKLLEQGRRQPNGNPYRVSTIKNKITGKG